MPACELHSTFIIIDNFKPNTNNFCLLGSLYLEQSNLRTLSKVWYIMQLHDLSIIPIFSKPCIEHIFSSLYLMIPKEIFWFVAMHVMPKLEDNIKEAVTSEWGLLTFAFLNETIAIKVFVCLQNNYFVISLVLLRSFVVK